MKLMIVTIILVIYNLNQLLAAEIKLLNADYLDRRILPDLSRVPIDKINGKFRNDFKKFKTLWEEYLNKDEEYDVKKGKNLLKNYKLIHSTFLVPCSPYI